jgi:hypothetical protein
MNLNTDQLFNYILPVVAGIITWFSKGKIEHALNLKREEKNQEAISLENLQKKLDIYQEMLKDIPLQYKTQMADLEANFNATISRLNNDLEAMRELNDELAIIIKDKQEIIDQQDKIISAHRATIAEYEAKHGPLK